MYISDIAWQIKRIKNKIKINPDINIGDFANQYAEEISYLFSIKESQAMYIVMIAINDYIKENKII